MEPTRLTACVLPIGDRLRAELSMRRHAPDGREHPSDAYVFGDEAGVFVSYGRLRRLWRTLCSERTVMGRHVFAASSPRMLARRIGRSAYTYTITGESSPRGSSRLRRTCTTCSSFSATRTSRRRARYLRSTPVRLKRALDKLEAAGSGQDSDKQPETAMSDAPEARAEDH
jgi:hypothetical protein